MISLNEVSGLVQQLQAIMKDSDGAVFGISIHDYDSRVQIDAIEFLTEFIDFDIEVLEDVTYPYRLSKDISGVTFSALLDAKKVADLETSIPNQFEYIAAKVQAEGV